MPGHLRCAPCPPHFLRRLLNRKTRFWGVDVFQRQFLESGLIDKSPFDAIPGVSTFLLRVFDDPVARCAAHFSPSARCRRFCEAFSGRSAKDQPRAWPSAHFSARSHLLAVLRPRSARSPRPSGVAPCRSPLTACMPPSRMSDVGHFPRARFPAFPPGGCACSPQVRKQGDVHRHALRRIRFSLQKNAGQPLSLSACEDTALPLASRPCVPVSLLCFWRRPPGWRRPNRRFHPHKRLNPIDPRRKKSPSV